MKKEKLYLSTIDPDAGALARQHGLGVEIAQFCTAWNMEEQFLQTDVSLQAALAGVPERLLHGPFNELFPCAIDPKARELAALRYRQAIALAKRYGAKKVVIHGGYNPYLYYPVWYIEQSVLFWREFLREDPGVDLVLENVLEEEPRLLAEIAAGVDDPRLGLCLDVGHANAYSKTPVSRWVEELAPWLSHVHLHNNDGSWDTHSPLSQGSIPMKAILEQLDAQAPAATLTLELPDGEQSIQWLLEEVQWT